MKKRVCVLIVVSFQMIHMLMKLQKEREGAPKWIMFIIEQRKKGSPSIISTNLYLIMGSYYLNLATFWGQL